MLSKQTESVHTGPKETHIAAAYRVLRYLHKMFEKGLLFKINDHLKMEEYADWHEMSMTKILPGYCCFMGGNPTSWKSKKHIVVA